MKGITVTGQNVSKVDLFLDFEIEGHRIVVSPLWLNLHFSGVPLPPGKCPSVSSPYTQPRLYTTCKSTEYPAKLLVERLQEFLERERTPSACRTACT